MLRFMSNHKVVASVTVVFLGLLAYVLFNGSYSYPVYEDGEVYIVERVIWDNHRGQIIGNPDFEPSFDNVDKDNFIEKFKQTQDALGYGFEMSAPYEAEDGYYDFEVYLNDKITLKYSEGFIKLSMEDYEDNRVCFYQALRTIYFTLSPDEAIDSFPVAKDVEGFSDYRQHLLPIRVDYRFYMEEGYEVHIEDMKMGH